MKIKSSDLIGNELQFSLEHRILNTTLLISIGICIVNCIVLLIFNLGEIMIFAALTGCVILALLYYLSIVKYQYSIPILLGMTIFIVVIYPIVWIFNAGTLGSFPYYVITFASIATILLNGFKRLVCIFCLVITTGILIALEYKYSFLIRGFTSKEARLTDIFLGLIITIISNAALYAVVLKNYNRERKKVTNYLAQLKKTNEQLRREITGHKQAEEALRESEDKYKTIFETTSTAVIIVEEDTTISLSNKEFEKLSGYSKSEIEGKVSWKQFISPEDVNYLVENHHMRMREPNFAPSSYEIHFIGRLGNKKDGLINVSTIPGTKKSVVSFTDIGTIKQAEAQLIYLATHDYLTGIPNRYSFEDSLKKTVAKAKRGKKSALLFLDIDNFKLVNDTKGHAAGDNLLISVGNTLKKNLRESDTLARLGGDEFGVLLEDTAVDTAMLVAEKLRQLTEENKFCLYDYGCFNLSLSIGVVMIDGTLNSQKLLSQADYALYAAKEKGRNRVFLLDPGEDITARFTEINQLIDQVKNAIKENKFVLHFQPIVPIDNLKVVHYEALVRLKGEADELISPQAFIPAAERYGLMPHIDRWVIESSLNIMLQQPDLSLFINISGISLGDDSLLEYIEQKIINGGVEPRRVGFEITETAAVKDILGARSWIERLKKLGCQFALDDFGMGFSSFSYLRTLPVDYLKIDGSFIRNLDKEPSHRAFVEAMSKVARSMGKKTIAEHVENENVLGILQELEIDCAQGFFLGIPTPII